jgi:hypothetical protein
LALVLGVKTYIWVKIKEINKRTQRQKEKEERIFISTHNNTRRKRKDNAQISCHDVVCWHWQL